MSAIDLEDRKVTIVGINYAPEVTGIGPYTTAMARALTEVGARVHVITGIPHYPQWSVEDAAYDTGNYWHESDHGVRLTRCRHWVPPQSTLKDRARMESSFFARALRILLRDRSELVIAVTPSLAGLGVAAAGSGRRPFAAVVQDLTGNAASETGAGDRVGAGLRAAEYGLLKRCAKVGVITSDFGRTLTEAGIRDDQLVDLPNFSHIAASTSSTMEARRRLGWRADRFTVVHTGNMGAKQGLHTVIEAAALSYEYGADIDFVLMGDGNHRAMLESISTGIPGLRILPPASAEDYPYVLAAADVVLINELPGVKMMSLPSKLTSYAAAGKPILAAVDPDGITAHYLGAMQFGHVVQSGDALTLLDAARSLRDNAIHRQALARASRRMHQTAYGKGAAYQRYQAFAASLLPDRAANKGQPSRQSTVGVFHQRRTATVPGRTAPTGNRAS